MSYCPVCGNEFAEGSYCRHCGFDSTRNYEQYPTLSPVLPEGARSISGYKAGSNQGETVGQIAEAFVCPRCGGNHFTFLVNEMKLECVDCGAKMPISNTSVSKSDPETTHSTENKTADPPAGLPDISTVPPKSTAPQSRPERPEGKKQLPTYGQNELTAIICTHCGLVNPDTNFVCDHCAKRLWRDTDPGASKNVFLYGWSGVVRRYDHIKIVAPSPPQTRPAPSTQAGPSASAPEPVTYPVIPNHSSSTPTKPMTSWGHTREEQEKIDRAFDILLGKSK